MVKSTKTNMTDSYQQQYEQINDVMRNTYVNACIYLTLVTYFFGFFMPVDLPVYSIFGITACYYVMISNMPYTSIRHIWYHNLIFRTIAGILFGVFMGSLSKYFSVKFNIFQLITENQPLLLVALIIVCSMSFAGVYGYMFEISKPVKIVTIHQDIHQAFKLKRNSKLL